MRHVVGRCRAPFTLNPAGIDYYYKHQVGGVIPPYAGVRYQRGSGLGGILSSLGRVAVPLLKKAAATVGKQALSSGVKLAGDIISGRNVKRAVKHRAAEGGEELVKKALKRAQSGGSRDLRLIFPHENKKRRRKTRKKGPPGRRVDIFD